MYVSRLLITALALTTAACASTNKKTAHSIDKPSWVSSTKITWDEGDQVLFRTQYTVRGDERVNGCYQLAKLESKETLLREMAEEIRGQIDNAQQSISENAEVILNQSRTSEFGGRITGYKYVEQFHERYKADGTERVDCFILGSIKKHDYETIRRQIVYKMAEVDPGLRKAMNDRQINFFKPVEQALSALAAPKPASPKEPLPQSPSPARGPAGEFE